MIIPSTMNKKLSLECLFYEDCRRHNSPSQCMSQADQTLISYETVATERTFLIAIIVPGYKKK